MNNYSLISSKTILSFYAALNYKIKFNLLLSNLEFYITLDEIDRIKDDLFNYYKSYYSNKPNLLLSDDASFRLNTNKARKYINRLKWIPGLEAVYLCNSLGFQVCNKNSDIDLFIITKPGYLFLVRFFIIFVFILFNVRVKTNNEKGRFCLSFFADTEELKLSHLAIENNDIYFAYWLNSLIPVYDPNDNLRIIHNLNRDFSDIYFKYPVKVKQDYLINEKSYLKPFWRYIFISSFGRSLNGLLMKLQLLVINKKYKHKKNIDGLLISKKILKFHEDDKRIAIKNRFELFFEN